MVFDAGDFAFGDPVDGRGRGLETPIVGFRWDNGRRVNFEGQHLFCELFVGHGCELVLTHLILPIFIVVVHLNFYDIVSVNLQFIAVLSTRVSFAILVLPVFESLLLFLQISLFDIRTCNL